MPHRVAYWERPWRRRWRRRRRRRRRRRGTRVLLGMHVARCRWWRGRRRRRRRLVRMELLHRCDEKVATRKSSALRSDKGCAPGCRVGSTRSSQAAAAAAPSPRVHAANRGRDTEASAVLRPTSGRRSRCANLPFCATPALPVSPPMVQRSAFRADEPARFTQGGHPDGSASSWVERELFPLYSCLNQRWPFCEGQ